MAKDILKFQRPIFSTGEENEILVYNKDRSIDTMFMMNEDDIAQVFPNDEFKTYWECEIKNKVNIEMLEQVSEQDW